MKCNCCKMEQPEGPAWWQINTVGGIVPSGRTAGNLSKQGHCSGKGHVTKATAYLDQKKKTMETMAAKAAVAHADSRPQKVLKLENLEKKQRVGMLRTAYYHAWNAEPAVRAPELFRLQSANGATSPVGESVILKVLMF